MRAAPAPSARRLFAALVAALAAGSAGAADPPGALPLDLAYARHEVARGETRPALSADGRWLAYEVESPRLRTPNAQGEVETRFLPDGTPSSAIGWRLWVAELPGGPSRALCEAPVNCWRGAWSPDSSALAYFSNAGGGVHLWIYEPASGRSRQVGDARIKAKLWPGDEAAWSPDGREVFVPLVPAQPAPATTAAAPVPETLPAAAEDDAALAAPTVTVHRSSEVPAAPDAPPEMDYGALEGLMIAENNAELAAVDVATGAARVVVPATAEPRPATLRLSPDGRWLSYLSVFRVKGIDMAKMEVPYDLAIAPAAGGPVRVVATGLHSPPDDYFGATYRWTPDARGIVFLKEQRLWRAPVSAGGPGEPRELGAGLGKLASHPLLITADGKAAVVGIEAEGERTYYTVPPKALAVVPLDGSAPRELAFTARPLSTADGRLWQSGPASFWALREVSGTADREVLRVDLATGASDVVWRGPGRLEPVGKGPGGGMVARFEDPSTPPDYYLFRDDFSGRDRITRVEPRLDDVAVGPVVTFTTPLPGHDGAFSDGQAAIFLPPGAEEGAALPALVYFYSGSRFLPQDYAGGAPNSIPVQVFTSRGYAVLLCDVPMGPQGKGGNPVQEMTEAVLAQVHRAAALGWIDPRRVAIMGQSYGGYSTAAVVTQTNLFRAGMALDGVYDLPGYYSRMDSRGGNVNFLWSETGQGRMGTHPWADLRRYLANSPYYQADKIQTPLLLIHGKQDDTCPVEEAEKMFNALKRLGREAELAVYDGEGHVPGEWALANAIDATQRMLDFLERHLRAQ